MIKKFECLGLSFQDLKKLNLFFEKKFSIMDNNGSNATLLSASDLCRAHLKSPDVPKPILEEAESGPQGSRKAFSNSSSNR